MKSKVILCMLLSGILFGSVSCTRDDTDANQGPFGDGESLASLAVTFHSLSNVPLGKTRSLKGDAIAEITDVFVAWYREDGTLAGSSYHPGEQLKISDIPRKESPTEQTTQRADFECRIPYGRYRIYAAVNTGDLSTDPRYASQIAREADFRQITLTWDADTKNNDQMSGYFTEGEPTPSAVRGEAPVITINSAKPALHAWVHRLASKVTISFDTTNLYENIYIHIKSAQIHNIPRTCTLLDPNDETRIAAPDEDVWIDGDTIEYGKGSDFNLWPRLTKGNNPLGGDPADREQLHANDARSLFFYENMQGKGKLKWQDVSGGNSQISYPDGNTPGKPGYRDDKPCGTYIEVEGFYISNTAENPGKGRIFYRFMLGKNADDDYNAERNFHYKLTMRFQGNANDVDWHIDYNEEPGIYVPNPYFISYLYDHSMMLPVKIKGKPVGNLKAEIIENDWRPYNAGEEFTYYRGEVYTMSGNPNGSPASNADLDNPKIKDGPWNGFLSLAATHINWIGRDVDYWKGYNYFYWKQKDFGDDLAQFSSVLLDNERGQSPRGYREYDISRDGTIDGGNDGDYIVSTDEAEGKTVLQIPCYTRALQLTDKTGFSGNNSYFSYRRSAKVRLTVQLEGLDEPAVDTVTIFQVRRIINPKGIYRRHDNDASFKVVLTHRQNEAATQYLPFESEGPWDATVEVGKEWIKINGVLGGSARGATGSEVQFTYQPDGTIPEDQCRFGIILVRYHNYSCYHRIFVRQGYAPAQIAGTAKWHCFNLCYENTEAKSPCEEGSLFRYGNIAQPIDAINNVFDDFKDHATTEFKLAPASSGKTGTWTAVAGKTQITSRSHGSAGFSDLNQTIGNSVCHVATYDDFYTLQMNCQFAYGVLYGDASTETNFDVKEIYTHAYYNDSNKNKGMRGCFVYNPKGSLNSGGEGANLFFPVGVSGYGRRKNCAQEGGKFGVLRYATRGALYTSSDVHYRPMFYTISTNFGAIYWLNQKQNGISAWDINVSTYDFNQFGNNAFLTGDWSTGKETETNISDACFVRLVE